ncbi:hypothetical protein TWF694_002375 [Orbilia ellipsospora]|uniref:DUF4211 domain-containing protein n=1 Tax=Orbilia ellipsospora TaxID=2528407 RepID=A0AAV9X4C3_9PEZI
MDRKENYQDHPEEPPRGRPLYRGRSVGRDRNAPPLAEGPRHSSAAAYDRTSNSESSNRARRVSYHGLSERSSHNPGNTFAPDSRPQNFTQNRARKSRSRSRDRFGTSDQNSIDRETRDSRSHLPSVSQSGSSYWHPSQSTTTYYSIRRQSTGYTAYPQSVHSTVSALQQNYTTPARSSTVREGQYATSSSNNENPPSTSTHRSPPLRIPRLESPVHAHDKRSSSASSNLSSAPPRKKKDVISIKDQMDIDTKGSAIPQNLSKLNPQRQSSKLGTQMVSADQSGSSNDKNNSRENTIPATSSFHGLPKIEVTGRKSADDNSSCPYNQTKVTATLSEQQKEPALPVTSIIELFENDSPNRAEKITSILEASKPSRCKGDQTLSESDAEGEADQSVPIGLQGIPMLEDSDVEESEVKLQLTWEENIKAAEKARAAQLNKASPSGKLKAKAQDKDSKRETRRMALQINPVLDHTLSRLGINPKKSDEDAYKALLFNMVCQLLFPKNHHVEGGNVSVGRERIVWLVMRGIRALYGMRFRAIIDEWRSEFKEEMRRCNFTMKSPYRWDRNEDGAKVILTRLVRDDTLVRCSCCKRRHKVSNGIQFFGTPCSNIQDGELDNMLFGPEEDVEKEHPPRQGENIAIRFNLGENCVKVIKIHHNLKHWERHLFAWVKQKLIDRKILGPDGASEFGLGRNKNSLVFDFTTSIFEPWLAEDEQDIMEQLRRLKGYVSDAEAVHEARDGPFVFKKRKKERKSKARVQSIPAPLPLEYKILGVGFVTKNIGGEGQNDGASAASNSDPGPTGATEGEFVNTDYYSDSDDYCFLDFDDILDLREAKESDRPRRLDKNKNKNNKKQVGRRFSKTFS